MMKKFKSVIDGDLDVFVEHKEEEFEGEILKWDEILIHGNPKGLKSFAKLLIKLSEVDQEEMNNLPEGAREHYHLRPKFELANSSDTVVVGRLDDKGTKEYYDRYIPKKREKKAR
jgi:hypothetical protein